MSKKQLQKIISKQLNDKKDGNRFCTYIYLTGCTYDTPDALDYIRHLKREKQDHISLCRKINKMGNQPLLDCLG